MPGFKNESWFTDKPLAKDRTASSDFGYFQNYMYTMFNGIDIFGWTVARDIEALDPNYYKDISNSYYTRLIGSNPIGSAAILGVAGVAALANVGLQAYQDYRQIQFLQKIKSIEGIKSIHEQAGLESQYYTKSPAAFFTSAKKQNLATHEEVRVVNKTFTTQHLSLQEEKEQRQKYVRSKVSLQINRFDYEVYEKLQAITKQCFDDYYSLAVDDSGNIALAVNSEQKTLVDKQSKLEEKIAKLTAWANANEIAANEHMEKVALNGFESLVARIAKSYLVKKIAFIWSFLAGYSFAYWMVFMVPHVLQAIFHTTMVLPSAAAFGIPLLLITAIPFLFYSGWKVYSWIKEYQANKQKLQEIKQTLDPSNMDEKIATKAWEQKQQAAAALSFILQQYYHKHLKPIFIKKRAAAIKAELNMQQAEIKTKLKYSMLAAGIEISDSDFAKPAQNKQGETLSEKCSQDSTKPLSFWNKIFKSRGWKVSFASLAGALGGYIVTQFVLWPFLDFAINVLHVSVSLGPITIIPFTIALTIGICYGIYSGVSTSKKCKEIEDALKRKEIITGIKAADLDILDQENAKLRETCQKLNAEVMALLKKINSSIQQSNTIHVGSSASIALLEKSAWLANSDFINQYHNERHLRTLKEQTDKITMFKSLLHYFQLAFGGAGGGIFIARTLLTPALTALGIIALFVPISWAVFVGVAIGFAVIMAGIRVYEHQAKKNLVAEQQNIKELATRKQYLESEGSVLTKMEKTLKERKLWLQNSEAKFTQKLKAQHQPQPILTIKSSLESMPLASLNEQPPPLNLVMS